MAFVLYSLVFATILFGTLLYIMRAHWLPALQASVSSLHRLPSHYYSRLPFGGAGGPGSFEDDIEAGLSSNTFDLGANVGAGDSRGGLDAQARAAILKIMKKRRMRFDEARRVYMEQRFAANGIGADGRPRDPKFVSFS